MPYIVECCILMCCRHQFRAAEKTKNTAQQLDKTPIYKPRAAQKEYVSCGQLIPAHIQPTVLTVRTQSMCRCP